MIPKGLFTQIAMVVVSIAIIITYIEPAFREIGVIQNDTQLYATEREKVAEVNGRLSSLVSRMESVSNADRERLLRYLPDTIDTIAVPRDLLLIANQAGVLYKDTKYISEVVVRDTVDPAAAQLPVGHQFTLVVEGSYRQLKTLFSLLEQNEYPLEVQEVAISQIEGGFLAADIQLVTYSYRDPLTNE